MSKTPKLRFKGFSGDWENHLLGKSITLYDNERKPVKEQERNSGEYAYYGATGIIDYIDDYIFEGEYLLLGEDGANIVTRNAPLIYKTQGKFWVNNHAHIFKPKNEFNIDFMKQRLELINYVPYNTGTAQPKLNADSIKSIPFKAPSIEEQEKIASFFSLIDDKISLQSEKLEMLKDYKKGMMQKIFSRELRFKDDEGRDYPEWEEKKLGDLANIQRGASPRPIADPKWFDENSNIGWVRISDVTSSNIYLNKVTQYLSNEGVKKSRLVEEPHLILSIAASIGKPIINKIPVCIHDGFIVFKDLELDILFGYYFLSMYQDKWESYKQPGAQFNLNSDLVANLDINVPCSSEQKKIASFLSKIDEKINKEQEKLDSLNKYQKGLLQQMFV